MIKKVVNALLLSVLLATQISPVKAGGGPSSNDLTKGFVVFGAAMPLGGAVVGVAGGFCIYKSFQWTRLEKGPKKYIGIGALACTGLAVARGLTYGYAKLSK